MLLSRSHEHFQPTLHYNPSALNESILAQCPSLSTPYQPTFWARNAHLQIMMYVRAEANAVALPWDLEERLTMADGGTVSLQWWGLSQPDVTAETPVLLVLPTITGCGDSLAGFVRRMQAMLGWVVVVCNRRGHGTLPLTSPKFNTLGDTSDLRAQIDAIQARRPTAPLYAVGMSAGSGLLARYLGEEADGCPLSAAVVFCPAYDMRTAFRRLHWLYDGYMTRQLIQYFLVRHEAQLKGVAGYQKARKARSFGELHDRLYGLAGFDDVDAYYQATNPMEVADQNRTPALVINAVDDPICTRQGLEDGIEALSDAFDSMVVAVTRFGSHCAFYEGVRKRRSWSDRVIVEYVQAAHATLHPSASQRDTP